MKKEKFHIEYVFDKASKGNLWNYLTTSSGLSEWFADQVLTDDRIFTFTWDKSSADAEQLAVVPLSYIRFRWLEEDDPRIFFEFRLHTIELTGGIMLEIIDFAEDDEKEDSIVLWDSQVKVLKRILGI